LQRGEVETSVFQYYTFFDYAQNDGKKHFLVSPGKVLSLQEYWELNTGRKTRLFTSSSGEK
jgi:ABC-type metal ion transport system substrate-binding protein